jgi:hypothetical protein
MGVTFRFIATPEEGSQVLSWFRELPEPPEVHSRPDGAVLFFRQYGPLIMTLANEVDVTQSPVVLVLLPQVRHGVLWTVGEVQFLADKMRSVFPALQRVLKGFRQWSQTFPLVFRQPHLPETAGGPWDYYLEGGVRNVSEEIFALPAGMAALERGQYFVWQGDSEGRLDTVLRMLRLRGVPNAERAAPNGGPATPVRSPGVTEGPPSVG